ncbi:MAG: nickel pincer cofactor biosynthesis protein LarB [Candidatus Omnitrophica bacterium]|nr:nickel pincer cofactor biosynthesis protein LarB [Candidatus Omnitrophota bacterium]MDD5436507.1 nickel pincer cofactor biosynthesis protein LarB [Candidatus Omnitrophota bacterium]
MTDKITRMLEGFKASRVSHEKIRRTLKDLPYKDIGFAKIDNHRNLRRGFPEVVFGRGKTTEQVVKIAQKIISHDGILLITHADRKAFLKLKRSYPAVKFDKKAKIISYRKDKPVLKKGTVLIVTAGTADLPVAAEAKATLEIMGNKVELLYDVGVAGLHRILDKSEVLDRASVIIVIAGMEGALASVVSGLVSKAVIAVPTSVGYGASFGGIAPLLTMINSCSPGIAVVNIDNGFGAAYFASLINS